MIDFKNLLMKFLKIINISFGLLIFVYIPFSQNYNSKMKRSVRNFQSSMINDFIFLNVEVQDDTYSALITAQLIKQRTPYIDINVEQLSNFLQKMPKIKISEILHFESNELSILVASLGEKGQHKIYLKCPLNKVEKKFEVPLSESLQRRLGANEYRLSQLEAENFDLKIYVQQLNIRLSDQAEKIKQIMDYVRLEVGKCRQEYKSKVDELSIMISEQKSFQSH